MSEPITTPTATTDTADEAVGAHAVTEVTKVLGAADILDAVDLDVELVDVPEWKGSVYVKGLSGSGRDEWLRAISENRPGASSANATSKLLVRCICDSEGNAVFDRNQVAALGAKSGAALERVSKVALRLSGLGEDSSSDAEGNSDDTPSDASTSSSASD